MSEQSYPVGTRLVVTWAASYQRSIGVSVGSECWPLAERAEPRERFDGAICQPVQVIDSHLYGWHPIAWLRPLSDPDPETIEQTEEVTA